MLKKSHIFYFFASMITTFVVGFFVWNIFLNPIDPKVLTASLSDYATESTTILPDIGDEEQGMIEEDLREDLEEEEVEEEQLALVQPEPSFSETRQDLLDDIQEKLDVIKQKVQELIDERDRLMLEEEETDEEEETTEEPVSCVGQIDVNTASIEDLDKIMGIGPATAQKIIGARPFCSLSDLLRVSGIGETTLQKITEQGCAYAIGTCNASVGGSGGGASTATYPRILISEVQILPINQRFVELYNPNFTDVNLTGWYLQRKTQTADKWGSFISAPKFENKTILSGGYILISRELENSDILLDITLSDNNSLVLKNSSGEISDKLGFGLAQDFELSSAINPVSGQSVGRKFVDGTEQDTDDNSADFEIQTPTPKSQNIAYTEPTSATLESIEITTPATKLIYNVGEILDIAGLVVTGAYSDGSIKVETITLADVTGFDSSAVVTGQILTITVGSQTITYAIDIIEPIDITPPGVIFNNLDPVQTALTFLVNFTITDIAESVTPSGVESYIFRWSEDNINWYPDAKQEIVGLPMSCNFSRDFTDGEDGKTYYFQVQATDVAGNISEWLPLNSATTQIVIPPPPPVAENMLTNEFFNEGWEGTSSAGNPIGWLWGKRGGIVIEDIPIVPGIQSFYHEPYSSTYYLKQLGKELEADKTYYVRVWAKGTGKIKAGIEVVGDVIKEPTFYNSLNNNNWTEITYSCAVIPGEETSNGGVTLKLTRYDAIGERLVIGAVWLGEAEPPEGWPL